MTMHFTFPTLFERPLLQLLSGGGRW